MQIKWIIKKPKPGKIRGHFAIDESGRYQITYDCHDEKFYLYDHKPKLIGVPNPYLLTWFDIKGLSDITISEVLIKMHRKIERYEKYYHLNHMSVPECTVKFKYEDLHINSCGKCRHLIFKDYKSMKGFCDLCRVDRNFEDMCIHEEEMQ